MALTQAISYDTAGNFTYDPTLVEIAGGVAKLKLQSNPGQTLVESFATDTGFTYDSTKAEFVGGLLRQKDTRPAGATFHASFNSSLNGDWGAGTLTGTSGGSAGVSGGKLNLKGGTVKYVSYAAALNAISQQTGCINVRYIPNYSGSPAAVRGIFSIKSGPTGFLNLVQLTHKSNGDLEFIVADSSGVNRVAMTRAFSPTSGVEYEIECNFDITSGATRVFINGVQQGASDTGTGTRSSSIVTFDVGTDYNRSVVADAEIQQITYFSTVQHTADYTAAAITDTIYQASAVTLPALAYTGPGSIQALSGFSVSEVGSPRYTVNGKYWDGAAWSISDNTYSQASSVGTINSNIATLGVGLGASVTVKVFFTDTNTQGSSDALTVNYAGQIYPTSNPSIIVNGGTLLTSILSFLETVTKPGSDEIKYEMVIDGSGKYWNGSAWVVSDDTYVKANTAADVNTNIGSLDLSLGKTQKTRAFLHSSDGSTTPELQMVSFTYDYFEVGATAPSKCYCFLRIESLLGAAVSSATLKARLSAPFMHGDYLIAPFVVSDAADANGFMQLQLVETETVKKTVDFELTYPDPNDSSVKKIKFDEIEIPNATSVDLSTLLEIES